MFVFLFVTYIKYSENFKILYVNKIARLRGTLYKCGNNTGSLNEIRTTQQTNPPVYQLH